MLQYLREKISPENPIRQIYYGLVSFLAALYYRYPANKLKIIAVTGTKGKTTVCNLISSILMEAGHKTGMTTTVNFKIGDNVWANKSKMTTLGRFKLQKLLRRMLDEGCEFVVIETSSHSLIQRRLGGINVDCAVFTNLQNDHLEYHGSVKKYREAKGILFKNLFTGKRKTGVEKISIINKDDKEFEYFDEFMADRKFSYGLRKADIIATNLDLMAHGTVFTLNFPNNSKSIYLPLPGKFNVYNALAASCVALSFGIGIETIKRALENESGVPGRVESVRSGQKFTVIVDYAHTVESLENICKLFKDLTKGKIILVFGCTGGGRDKAKRPLMGEVAHKYADQIVLTDDDPYAEDRFSIIEDIVAGIPRKEGEGLWKVVNRREAIRLALTMAKENDTVLIAGKGGEEVQAMGNELIDWSDKRVVKELLSRTVEVSIEGKVRKGVNKCMRGE